MLWGFDVCNSFPDACLKTFGIRLEEVLVNEITRRKHLELEASMLDDDAPGPRGNVAQRMFGRMRRFFNRRRIEPTLPREFTRRGRRVSSVSEVSGRGPLWRGVKACVLMVWGLNRNRRGGVASQHLGRSQRMILLLHFKKVLIFPQGAVSVDSLSELEGGDQLLQNLQISQASLPIGQRLLGSKRKMSLNPIARQVPQIVEICCKFIEKHGKETTKWFNEGKQQVKGKGRMF